jgi:hypothetical protein
MDKSPQLSAQALLISLVSSLVYHWQMQVGGVTPAPTTSSFNLGCSGGDNLESGCCCNMSQHTYDIYNKINFLWDIKSLTTYTTTAGTGCSSTTTVELSNDAVSYTSLTSYSSTGQTQTTTPFSNVGVFGYVRFSTTSPCHLADTSFVFNIAEPGNSSPRSSYLLYLPSKGLIALRTCL